MITIPAELFIIFMKLRGYEVNVYIEVQANGNDLMGQESLREGFVIYVRRIRYQEIRYNNLQSEE